MHIEPLSFDSMGTRSMCTYIETEGMKIVIDPGVSLAPKRYGLPPHDREKRKMQEDWKKIVERSKGADTLIITHYHYDHYNPEDDLGIYEGKKVFIKDPEKSINHSQRKRAAYFLERIKGIAGEVIVADANSFSSGKTEMRFSQPVPHGTDSQLGYVIETFIRDSTRSFLHTSDVEGMCREEQRSFVIENNPEIIFMDGAQTYLMGYAFSQEDLVRSVDGMREIIDACDIKKMVVDHHLLRDLEWQEKIFDVLQKGEEKGTQVMTAAEFSGKENLPLEARRRELYKLTDDR